MQARTQQRSSAVASANKAGVQHGGTYDTEVLVGATPAGQSGEVDLHYCSSRMHIVQTLKQGDGTPVPAESAVVCTNVPEVKAPCFLVMRAQVHSNGRLSLQNSDARMIPIPRELQEECPWAFNGGFESVAEELGLTPDELKAQAVAV